MNEISLDQLSGERFAELVRTKFQVAAGANLVVELELTAVTRSRRGAGHGSPSDGSEYESFSLLFDGPATKPLEQRIHRFAHERLGSFDLFIVPVGAERGALQYEAVFNRRLTSNPPGQAPV